MYINTIVTVAALGLSINALPLDVEKRKLGDACTAEAEGKIWCQDHVITTCSNGTITSSGDYCYDTLSIQPGKRKVGDSCTAVAEGKLWCQDHEITTCSNGQITTSGVYCYDTLSIQPAKREMQLDMNKRKVGDPCGKQPFRLWCQDFLVHTCVNGLIEETGASCTDTLSLQPSKRGVEKRKVGDPCGYGWPSPYTLWCQDDLVHTCTNSHISLTGATCTDTLSLQPSKRKAEVEKRKVGDPCTPGNPSPFTLWCQDHLVHTCSNGVITETGTSCIDTLSLQPSKREAEIEKRKVGDPCRPGYPSPYTLWCQDLLAHTCINSAIALTGASCTDTLSLQPSKRQG